MKLLGFFIRRMGIVWPFILLFCSVGSAIDILANLSQASARLWGAGSCPVIPVEAPLCGPKVNLKQQAQAILQASHSVAAGMNEDKFFASLALQHSREMDCSADFAKQLAADTKTESQEARKDIALKVQILREAKQRLNRATTELARNINATQKICPLTAEELKPDPIIVGISGKDEGYELCKEILVTRAAYEAVYRSIPLSGAPAMREFLEHFANAPGDADFEKINSDIEASVAKAYKATAAELKSSAKNLLKQGQGDGTNIDRATRYALLSDPLVVSKVIDDAGPSNKEMMTGYACRADQRFGSGADALERNVLIGSVLISGGAGLILRGGVIATRVAMGVRGARAYGMLSVNAARTLEISALAMTAGTDASVAFSQVREACFAQSPLMAQGTAAGSARQCVSAPRVQQLEQDSCVVASSLSAIGFVSGAAAIKNLLQTKKTAQLAATATSLNTKMLTNLDSEARLNRASEVLGHPLASEQQKAILEAHDIGSGQIGKDGGLAGVGNYTAAQLRAKSARLKAAGFNEKEIRELMENKIVGVEPSMSQFAAPLPAQWPVQTQEDFQKAFIKAKSEPAGIRRMAPPGKSPNLSMDDIQSAVATQLGKQPGQIAPSVSTEGGGKVVMTYKGSEITRSKVEVRLNATNGQYYYTIIEDRGGVKTYMMVSRTNGRWTGLRPCTDMSLCHYGATGF